MPGVKFYSRRAGGGIPEMVTALVGKSTWIRTGDVVVATNVNTRTQSSNLPLVARPMYSGDTMTVGIIGVALYDIRTDSAGKVISAPPNAGVVTTKGNDVIYPVATVESSQFDETTGYVKAVFARWCSQNKFKITVASDDTVSEVNLNIAYGILPSTTVVIADPTAVTYTLDIDDTTNPQCVVRDWTPRDATSIATAGGVEVIVEPLDTMDDIYLRTYQTD